MKITIIVSFAILALASSPNEQCQLKARIALCKLHFSGPSERTCNKHKRPLFDKTKSCFFFEGHSEDCLLMKDLCPEDWSPPETQVQAPGNMDGTEVEDNNSTMDTNSSQSSKVLDATPTPSTPLPFPPSTPSQTTSRFGSFPITEIGDFQSDSSCPPPPQCATQPPCPISSTPATVTCPPPTECATQSPCPMTTTPATLATCPTCPPLRCPIQLCPPPQQCPKCPTTRPCTTPPPPTPTPCPPPPMCPTTKPCTTPPPPTPCPPPQMCPTTQPCTTPPPPTPCPPPPTCPTIPPCTTPPPLTCPACPNCPTLPPPQECPSCPPPPTCPTIPPCTTPPPLTCPACPNCPTLPPPQECPSCPPPPTCPTTPPCTTPPPLTCPPLPECPTLPPPQECPSCPPPPTCPTTPPCTTPPPLTCPPLPECPTLICPACPTCPPQICPECPTLPPPAPCPKLTCPACPTLPPPTPCPTCQKCPTKPLSDCKADLAASNRDKKTFNAQYISTKNEFDECTKQKALTIRQLEQCKSTLLPNLQTKTQDILTDPLLTNKLPLTSDMNDTFQDEPQLDQDNTHWFHLVVFDWLNPSHVWTLFGFSMICNCLIILYLLTVICHKDRLLHKAKAQLKTSTLARSLPSSSFSYHFPDINLPPPTNVPDQSSQSPQTSPDPKQSTSQTEPDQTNKPKRKVPKRKAPPIPSHTQPFVHFLRTQKERIPLRKLANPSTSKTPAAKNKSFPTVPPPPPPKRPTSPQPTALGETPVPAPRTTSLASPPLAIESPSNPSQKPTFPEQPLSKPKSKSSVTFDTKTHYFDDLESLYETMV